MGLAIVWLVAGLVAGQVAEQEKGREEGKEEAGHAVGTAHASPSVTVPEGWYRLEDGNGETQDSEIVVVTDEEGDAKGHVVGPMHAAPSAEITGSQDGDAKGHVVGATHASPSAEITGSQDGDAQDQAAQEGDAQDQTTQDGEAQDQAAQDGDGPDQTPQEGDAAQAPQNEDTQDQQSPQRTEDEVTRFFRPDCELVRGRYLARLMELHGADAFALDPRALAAWTHKRPPPLDGLGDPAMAPLYGEPPVPPGALSFDPELQGLARELLLCQNMDQ